MLYRMIGEEKDDIPATNIFEGTTGSRVEFFCQSNCPKNYKMLLLVKEQAKLHALTKQFEFVAKL